MTSAILYLFLAINYVTACIKMVHPDMEGMSTTDMPVTQEPVTDEPLTNVPVTAEPVTEEPATDEPATEEPITEEPVTEEPITEEPVTEEPVTEEPVTEEPVTEEPVTEEPVTEEPVTEEPVTDAPVPCKTCKPETLFNPADLTDDAFYPVPENLVEPFDSAGCNAVSINCYQGDEKMFKDTQGDFYNGPWVDSLYDQVFICNDEGKYVSDVFGEAGTVFCESMQ